MKIPWWLQIQVILCIGMGMVDLNCFGENIPSSSFLFLYVARPKDQPNDSNSRPAVTPIELFRKKDTLSERVFG